MSLYSTSTINRATSNSSVGGATCSVSSPECYKKSTQPDEDFICEWVDQDNSKDVNYTLFMQNTDRICSSYNSNFYAKGKRLQLPLEDLRITCLLDIWVQKRVGQMTCNSENTSVVLSNSVKYNPPIVITVRNAGNLTLSWARPNDNKGAIHKIRWKKINGSWQNEIFATYDRVNKDNLETYTMQLEKDAAYQVQVRRKEKQSLLWSDWSQMHDIPIEIKPLDVKWREEKLYAGRRKIILYWDKPPREASFGGLTYKLTLHLPCQNKTATTNITSFEMFVTYSGARVSFVATNNVGSVSSKQITIPPVKHLQYCPTDTLQEIQPKKQYCLEWYELRDAINKLAHNNSEIEKFVRHYYFLHTGKDQHRATEIMCQFYSTEGKPAKSPQNVTISDIKQDSATLSWKSIPVQDQHGFLKDYVIWISRKGQTDTTYQVPANQTSFPLKNLEANISYTVYMAGKTKIGAGPKINVTFTTISSADNGLLNKIITSLCGCLLLLSIVFSIAIRRLRNKLLPAIPSPVITTTAIHLDAQNMKSVTEEVHDVILLRHTDQPKQKQHTLLQDCESSVNDHEEDEIAETLFTSLIIRNSYPNPNYKGQTITFSELLEVADKSEEETCEVSTPLYKNGLFFDSRGSESEETSVQL
ncbi:interleukin-31 receptor subunit alpha [Trichomycterus rosablanca]|uniref:interleukin-31 receptor subunit alpha n=1 Tax=Trichomycterus rosablanca TaxID=2290929 RepID=UPI002F35310E